MILQTRSGAGIRLTSSLAPEDALLLTCLDPEPSGLPMLMRPEIDWARLLSTARRHRVLPLVAQALQTCCAAQLPAEVRSSLDDYTARSTERNLFMTGELSKLLALFRAHDLVAVPIKGVSLASIYGGLGLRPGRDLDLVIRREDVLTARRLLLAEGWQLAPDNDYSEEAQSFFLRARYSAAFDHPNTGVRVELHWRIIRERSLFDVEQAGLWESLTTTSLAGMTIPAFSSENMLLLLLLHGSRHLWDELIWVCDVAYFLRAYPPTDWDALLARADRLHIGRFVQLGLQICAAVFPDSAAATLAARPTDPAIQALAGEITRAWFTETQTPERLLQGYVWRFRLLQRTQDRAWWLLNLVYGGEPTAADTAFVALPPRFYFLYILIRPVRIVRDYLPRLLRFRRTVNRQQRPP